MEQYEVGTLAVDGWAVTFGTARRRGLDCRLSPLLAVPTASVPITVVLYDDGLLLCGFNVATKGLINLLN